VYLIRHSTNQLGRLLQRRSTQYTKPLEKRETGYRRKNHLFVGGAKQLRKGAFDDIDNVMGVFPACMQETMRLFFVPSVLDAGEKVLERLSLKDDDGVSGFVLKNNIA